MTDDIETPAPPPVAPPAKKRPAKYRRHPTAFRKPSATKLAAAVETIAAIEVEAGHKRDGGPGRPLAAFDVDFHTSPATKAPPWTPERIAKFCQTYFDTLCDFRKTCHRLRIPYRAAVGYRETDAEFGDRLRWVDKMHRERVKGEFNRRVMEDERHPANIIFDLKKMDPAYADAVDRKPVQIAVMIGDSALKRPAAALDDVIVRQIGEGDG